MSKIDSDSGGQSWNLGTIYWVHYFVLGYQYGCQFQIIQDSESNNVVEKGLRFKKFILEMEYYDSDGMANPKMATCHRRIVWIFPDQMDPR